jgi:hypothetical protein
MPIDLKMVQNGYSLVALVCKNSVWNLDTTQHI